MKTVKIFTAALLALIAAFGSTTVCFACTDDYALYTIKQIANWKKAQCGIAPQDNLLNEENSNLAGNGIDWYVIALSRVGISDNYNSYLNAVSSYITDKYKTTDRLGNKKATEWHRITLAVLSAGGNPVKIGSDTSGNPVNLIADGVYNKENLTSQGINGAIWGLIALDSRDYSVPSEAINTRESIIKSILENQLGDGGFALIGNVSDVDITSDALTALAPYKNSALSYTYTNKKTNETLTKTIPQVIEEALSALSAKQDSDSGFSSWGTKNSESTSRVITALCSLKINPDTDSRFIKNGNMTEALLSFQESDGGIAHIKGNGSNSIAGEQAICALAAYYRLLNNEKSIYDFTAEQTNKNNTVITENEKNSISAEKNEIQNQLNTIYENEDAGSEDFSSQAEFSETTTQDIKEQTENTEETTLNVIAEVSESTGSTDVLQTEADTEVNPTDLSNNGNLMWVCIAIGILAMFGSAAWGINKNRNDRKGNYNPLSVNDESESDDNDEK